MRARLLSLFLLAVPALGDPRPPLAARDPFAQGRHRGMSYAHSMRPGQGYGSPDSARSLDRLRELGVKWISITPFGFQRDAGEATFRWAGRGARGLGESDDRLRAVTVQARAHGLRVMLKPHIWLRPPQWPGSIEPRREEDWAEWFRTYQEFIVHYAALAESAGMDAFCVGNELEKTTPRQAEWRRVIGAVRAAYRGPLTYGANTEEVFRVPFWDALDFIGVSAYYPLRPEGSPGRAALAQAWRPITARLGELAARHGRRVVFTELGYRSAPHAAWKQWEVTDASPVDLGAQAEAYAAFFEAVWPEPWLGGVYWWKWFSHPGHSGPHSNDYELENKPAEVIVRAHYTRPAPPAR